MLRTIKPKNARVKRALDAHAPKEVEDARTAVFVKGTHSGVLLSGLMKDLMGLKRPDAVPFNKKNDIHPFDASTNSIQSLEFWAGKNNASLFLIGQTTKKRPHGLTFVRMFDRRVLDMLEVGVENYVPMSDFKTPKSSPGHKPLMHFASELFETHSRFAQLKSMLLDFFNGEEIESICLPGIEHVISVSLAPTPETLNTTATDFTAPNSLNATLSASLPKVHLRVYTIKFLRSGTRIPRVELTLMGPSVDFVLRRNQEADPDMLREALKKPKLKKSDVEKGLGKKRKNKETDEMGDLRGQIHIGKQNLDKLQTRKMKGLKPSAGEQVDSEEEEDEQPRKKRKQIDEQQ